MTENPIPPPCECALLRRAIENEWFPVAFDEEMGEVQLVLDCGERGKGMAVFRYCPWCGGELAESNRGSHFTTPGDSDIEIAQNKMHSVQSVAQMLEVLGPPSHQFENELRNQYTYADLFDSLVLVVFENKNRMDFSFHGKRKSNDDLSQA